MQQVAMSLLGNLLTDMFDPDALDSLALFVDAGGLQQLQGMLSAAYPLNLCAVATLQNVTSLDPFDCCDKLRAQGCAAALGMLASSDDQQLAEFALGTLSNLRTNDPSPVEDAALEEALRMRRLRDIVSFMQSNRAVDKVQKYAKRWIEKHRAAKALRLESAERDAAAARLQASRS